MNVVNLKATSQWVSADTLENVFQQNVFQPHLYEKFIQKYTSMFENYLLEEILMVNVAV